MGVFVAGVPSSLAPRTPFFSRVLAPLPPVYAWSHLEETRQEAATYQPFHREERENNCV